MINKNTLVLPLVLSGCFLNAQINAATITVVASEVNVNNGNGSCSLREAIANAESNSDTSGGDCVAGSGTDTIELTESTYSISDAQMSDSLYGDSGLTEINSTLIINGNNATIQRDAALFTSNACSGSGAKFRLIYLNTSANLTINNLTLQNGCAQFSGHGAGGAIFNRGTLNINESTLSSNEASNSAGAIQNDGTLTLTQSTISSNRVISGAGGGIVNRGTLQLIQSIVDNNTSQGAGGGLDIGNTSTFANTTIGENQSNGLGGGIFQNSSAVTTELVNSTLVHNRAFNTSQGSAIYRSGGTLNASNTLFGHSSDGSLCSSGVSDSGSNMTDDGSCPGTTVANINIAALSDNGGATRSYQLQTGSPAIAAANNTVCSASPINNQDQRGITRGSHCDVGAYQSGEPLATTVTISGAAQVGTFLNGTYVYSDSETDAEDTGGTSGSSYRFVRSADTDLTTTSDNTDVDNGFTGGSPQNYTVSSGDLGSYLFYCVTPKASAGTPAGFEACSLASSAVTQAPPPSTVFTVPDAPSIAGFENTDESVEITFSSPFHGGTPITEYAVDCGSGHSATGTESPVKIDGLVAGISYQCTVTATNNVGSSSASSEVTVFFTGAPQAPSIETAIAGDGSASIEFVEPDNNGGLEITQYTVTCGSVSVSGTSSPIQVSGLDNGTHYDCTVVATNEAGDSLGSSVVSVTPQANVVAPTTTPEPGTSPEPGPTTSPTPNPTDSPNPNPTATPVPTTTPSTPAVSVPGETMTFSFSGSQSSTLSVAPLETTLPTPPNPAAASSLSNVLDISSTSPGENGFGIMITFNLPENTEQIFTGYWKFGPENGGESSWYDFGTLAENGDGTGYEISNGGKTLKVHLVDGMRGDDDLSANGAISDPALPIVKADTSQPIPTLSFWGLMLLSAVIMLLGLNRSGRKIS